MNTGKLNRRISYKTGATYADTALGGKTVTSAGTTTETWCSARQLSMRELIQYGMPIDYRAFEFAFHYDRGTDIQRGFELTYESKVYKVNSILEVDEMKREIRVTATNQGG